MPLASLPADVQEALVRDYPDLGNCLYFVLAGQDEQRPGDGHQGRVPRGTGSVGDSVGEGAGAEPGKAAHAVLYDIGSGLVNWLVYENRSAPAAAPGRTTTAATPDDIRSLRSRARACWGDGLGRVIEATPGAPFSAPLFAPYPTLPYRTLP